MDFPVPVWNGRDHDSGLSINAINSKRVGFRIRGTNKGLYKIGPISSMSATVDGRVCFEGYGTAQYRRQPSFLVLAETQKGDIQTLWFYQKRECPVPLPSIRHAMKAWLQFSMLYADPSTDTVPFVLLIKNLGIKRGNRWDTLYGDQPLLRRVINRRSTLDAFLITEDKECNKKRKIVLLRLFYYLTQRRYERVNFKPIAYTATVVETEETL